MPVAGGAANGREMSLRSFFVVPLLTLLASSVGCAGHGERAYRHPETGLTFPSEIGHYRRASVIRFRDPRLGVRIRYEGPGRADVFVYNGGFSRIPTGIDGDEFRRAFAQSERNIATLTTAPPFKGGTKVLEAQPTIDVEGRVARLRVAAYASTQTQRDGSEVLMQVWLLMTGYRNNFLKLLFTIPGEGLGVSQPELRKLILGFVDANRGRTEAFLLPRKTP